MNPFKHLALATASVAALTGAPALAASAPAAGDWTTTGGNAAHTKFSPLTQITTDNVGELEELPIMEDSPSD